MLRTLARRKKRPRRVFEEVKAGDTEEESDEQSWETEDSGLGDAAEKLIDQLYLSLGSMKAMKTSSKLRKSIVLLLGRLVKQGILNEFQRRKIIRDYIR